MKSILALAALALHLFGPGAAHSQSWFTKDVCRLTPAGLERGVDAASALLEARGPTKTIENGVGRFWRITAPNGAVSHLWGTIHSTDPMALRLPDRLRETVETARVVAFEYDPTSLSRRILTKLALGTYYDRSSVPAGIGYQIDPEVRSWITARLTALGWASDAAEWIPLAELALVLLVDPCNDFSAGVIPIQDSRIQLLALEEGAEIDGLERWDAFQKDLIRPEFRATADAIIELYGASLNPEGISQGRHMFFALYLAGRIGDMMVLDEMWRFDFFGEPRGRELHDLMHKYLVDGRHRRFTPTINRLVTRGNAVIAVGAFHLPGEQGLVSLLRKSGYMVERTPVMGERP